MGLWKNIFESEVYKTKFHPVEHTVYEQTLVGTTQGVIDRALSKSFITALPEEKQAELSKQITDIVNKGDGKVWIDEVAGTFGECERGSWRMRDRREWVLALTV